MKITEIRNKLFGLSDLRSLIQENAFEEGRAAANAPSLSKFFKEHPEFIGMTYGDTTENGAKFREALHVYFDGLPNNFPSNEEYALLSGPERKIYSTRIRQANRVLQGQYINANKAISLPGDSYGDKPESILKTPLEHLRDFFNNHGGSGIAFSEGVLHEPELLEKYVLSIKKLADDAGAFFANSGVRISSFSDKDILVGSERDPFSLYLFFYYQGFCETRGNWEGKKTELYLQNIENPNVKEYVKYVLNITPNIFKTILECSDNAFNGLSDKIISEGFGGAELIMSRSMAYFKRYSQVYPGLFDPNFLKNICLTFGFREYDSLFDPLENIQDKIVTNGILAWCKGTSDEDIKKLVKPVLNGDQSKCSPIEKIFLTAEAIDELLRSSYKKYGEGPAENKMTVGLLLEDAEKGIDYWNSLNRRGRIPKAQVQLRTIYKIERDKNPESESIPFWKILNFDKVAKDKTQSEIFYFLIGNSAEDVKWTYEYNRSKKSDTDLGDKSIDILGQTNNNTFCFEYQGEQHYRPLTVTYNEYAEFPFFTKMREYILTECGFVQKTVGGTKFFIGMESANKERIAQIKQIIINAYKKFANELSVSLGSDYNISSRINEGFNGLGGLNKKAKFENDAQMYAYFQKVLSESETVDVFEEPPMQEIVSYLGSPKRFLDEVKTAQDMGRDMEKREIIRRKEANGWILSYIIPRGATEDEKKYTEELAGNENLVFPWNSEGKEKLIGFMKQNNILADGVLNENTLFQQIINELLNR